MSIQSVAFDAVIDRLMLGLQRGRTLFAMIAVAICLAGCAKVPADADGRFPLDIAKEFIELSESDKFDEARQLWTHESVSNMGGREEFVANCRVYVELQMTPRKAFFGKDKSVVFVPLVIGQRGEHYGRKSFIYFKLRDGKWKIHHHRIEIGRPI